MRHRENCIVKTVSNRILILCEGLKTEPNYFNAFKKIKGLSSVTIYPTKINTAKELLKLAKNLQDQAKNDRSPFEEIWLVFDKDGYTKHPEVFDSVRSLQNDVIKIAFSSPCFEFWYLLHFAETTAPFKDCDDVKAD